MVDFRKEDPPRKASCVKGHPDHHPYSKHIGIKFRGVVMMANVYTYDQDEGWVEISVKDHRGRPKFERGKIVVMRAYGPVETYWR